MAKINWTKESEAMELLGYTDKYALRTATRDEKRKKLPIRTIKLNFKTVLYSKEDIEGFIKMKEREALVA